MDPMSPSGSVKVKPEPPHLSPDIMKRRRFSVDSEVVDDAGPPILDGETTTPTVIHRPVLNSRPPLRSQLAAQLCGSSTKQLKRPTVVVRPSGIPTDNKLTARMPGNLQITVNIFIQWLKIRTFICNLFYPSAI